jgi:hypothetical protein
MQQVWSVGVTLNCAELFTAVSTGSVTCSGAKFHVVLVLPAQKLFSNPNGM